MSAFPTRILFGSLWVASLVTAFFVGRVVGPGSGDLAEFAKPSVRTLADSDAPASGSAPAGGDSGPAAPASDADGASPARSAREAIGDARRELGSGGGGFFYSPSAMFRAFAPLMELPAEQVRAAIDEVESSITEPQQKQMFLSLLLGRWAEESPREALAYAEKMIEESGPAAGPASFSVIGAWAQRDPDAVWDWYVKKRDSDTLGAGVMGGDAYLAMIFSGMALRDVDKALGRLTELDDDQGSRQAAFGIASSVAQRPGSRDRVLARSASLPPDLRDSIRQGILSQWAVTGTDEAMGWLRTLPTGERDQLIGSAGYSLMMADPEKGAEFLMEDATEENLSSRYQTIVSGWANRDLNAAGEWLNAQPASPAQDGARSGFAMQVARRDPESAMEWAKSVSDEGRRFGAIRNVHQQWRKKDADAADAALVNSGLPDEKIEQLLQPPPQGKPGNAIEATRR